MVAITLAARPSVLRASLATRSAGVSRRALIVRAFRDEETASSDKPLKDVSAQLTTSAEETFEKIQAAWEASEEKPTIVAAGTLGLLTLYFLNNIVTAVDKLPLFSTIFELVGLAYTGYTAYKYFLVPGEKEALTSNIKSFVKKVGIDL